MPSRPIYPDDSVSTPDANQWFPLVDLNTSTLSDQNRRMSGGWLLAALNNPIVYNVSATPDNGTTLILTYVAVCSLRIPTDPTWYAYSGTAPGTSRTCAVSKVVSGILSTVGNVTVNTSGVVSASPSWATEDLAAGDAVRISLPFDGTWANVGIGFLAKRIV